MFCKKCGNPLQDGSRFCPKCGASMQNDTNPFVSPFPEENVGTSMQMPQEMAVPEKRSRKTAWIAGISCACVLLLAAAGLIYFLVLAPKDNDADHSAKKKAAMETTVTELTTERTKQTKEQTTEKKNKQTTTKTTAATEPATTEAPEKRTGDESVYASVLQETQIEADQNYDTSLLYDLYYLYDINQDGVRELLVHIGTCEADAVLRIYTLNDAGTEAEQVGEIDGGHMGLSEKNGSLYSMYCHMGYQVVLKVDMVQKHGSWTIQTTTVLEQDNVVEYTNYGTSLQSYPLSDATPVGGSNTQSKLTQAALPDTKRHSASTSVQKVNDRQGQLNCHGGVVSGYTTSYVCEGGAYSTVRDSLGDTWHVTAKNTCTAYGVQWYELWDSDDGDYYGWVDANYIDFYE
ncbi:MAG: zinc-ribbon domain-containing protein [Ruminococcus sp.]|nr:zinc ribbon domain-containing protein [Ruminococcus sp.]